MMKLNRPPILNTNQLFKKMVNRKTSITVSCKKDVTYRVHLCMSCCRYCGNSACVSTMNVLDVANCTRTKSINFRNLFRLDPDFSSTRMFSVNFSLFWFAPKAAFHRRKWRSENDVYQNRYLPPSTELQTWTKCDDELRTIHRSTSVLPTHTHKSMQALPSDR